MTTSSRWLPAALWGLAMAGSSAMLAFAHYMATLKCELQPLFVVVNAHAIHNIRLIAAVDSHPGWALEYLALWLAILVFCCWRRYPAWVASLSFAAFGSPLVLYLGACGHIAGKIVDWAP